MAKGPRDENFPVGSRLIEPRLRPTVMAYYALARAADDVADDPALAPAEKIARLDRFEAALAGRLDAPDVTAAVRAREALAAAGVPVERASQLLRAFQRDAEGLRCRDWNDLMGYCADSANPVGRFLLDLHGESPGGYPAADALCTALQVLNHLQDCGGDFRALGRVYLPADWLAEEGVDVAELGSPRTGPRLRRVLDRCLSAVASLLGEAGALPLSLRSTRLALESAVILRLAERLARELAACDPLAERVRLSRPAMLRHGAAAAVGCGLGRMLGRRTGHRRQPA